jgi:hypothetical protein
MHRLTILCAVLSLAAGLFLASSVPDAYAQTSPADETAPMTNLTITKVKAVKTAKISLLVMVDQGLFPVEATYDVTDDDKKNDDVTNVAMQFRIKINAALVLKFGDKYKNFIKNDKGVLIPSERVIWMIQSQAAISAALE